MSRVYARPVTLYVASVFGAAFAALVGLIGVSQLDAIVLAQSILGLFLYGSIGLLAPSIVGSAHRRWWIVLLVMLGLLIAAAGGVTGLFGYSPAIATLLVALVKDESS